MDPDDRYCMLSYDEMQIFKSTDYDVSSGKHFGYVTLDPTTKNKDWNPTEDDLGEKIFVVLKK